ncbi:hypothetical protein WJX82_004698 [Trebouxia sp. C0006]
MDNSSPLVNSEAYAAERKNEDFAMLRQAAMERTDASSRHPTVALPANLKGEKTSDNTDVDVRPANKLGRDTRKKIVDEALATKDQDQYRFLKLIKDRMDAVGIAPSTVEVRFQDLHIQAKVFVGARALPSVLNSYRNFFEGLLQTLHLLNVKKRKFVILDQLSGRITPRRMTLLLGPPGSGKSTLLAALAGKLRNSDLQVKGSITYNGHTFDEFIPERTSSYIDQQDIHLAELTVRETFDFAARCQGTGHKAEELAELRKREKEQGIQSNWEIDSFMAASALEGKRESIVTEYMLRILGLDVCADTPVGSAMIRGISGGQKKRVTTGEMMVGPKKTLFMDEISTGLDSSTTFQIVKCMGDFVHLREGTVLMSLLQPAPEVYNLFDDVLLLSEGNIVFHGPREDVVEFFESCGFCCPERKGVPDFLQEVTSKNDQKQYWTGSGSWQYVPVASFAEAFKKHKTGLKSAEGLAVPFDKTTSSKDALVHERFSLSNMQAFKAMMRRETTLIQRTVFVYIFKAVQAAIVAIIAATLFLRTHLHPNSIAEGQLYSGFLFFSLLQMFFSGIAEMTFAIERLPVFFKQRDNFFFPAWTFVIPTTLMRLPVSFVESLLWTVITYFEIDLAPTAGRFFVYWLILFLVHNMAICLFRTIGALARDLVVANAIGSLALLAIMMMGGFVIPKASVHPWVVWVYWIDPLQYAQRALIINEFTASRWGALGPQLLSLRAFPNHYWWVWVSVGFLIGAIILFHFIIILAQKVLGPLGNNAAVLSEEALRARDVALYGQSGKGDLDDTVVDVAEQRRSRRSLALRGASKGDLTANNSAALSNRRLSLEKAQSRKAASSQKALDSRQTLEGQGIADGHQKPPGTAVNPLADVETGQLHLDTAMETGDLATHSQATSNNADKLRSGGDSMRKTGNSFKESNVEKGMVLPFTPLTMTFHDVHYFVDCPPEMQGKGLSNVSEVSGKHLLELLRGISGAFRPGILTCLMGVSGAGKTTLMDVLSGRKTGGVIQGDIRMNGYPKEQATFARVSGYVEQFDVHSPQTTVREALLFSAQLRTRGETTEVITAFVDEVMDLVELHSLRDGLVGVPGQTGLSVEQRKRLTIAVELVANPSIVFMDEPTSGLDARAAAIVMRTVRNIVNTGRTIVCTIHQPSIDIFESFDELLLLKRGGQTIYAGHLGDRSSDLIAYYEAVPGVQRAPEGLNPATWMLEVTMPGNEQRLGVDFSEVYQQSNLYRQMEEIIQEGSQPDTGVTPLKFDTVYARSLLQQYRICLWKFNITYWRTPNYNATRFSFSIAVALIFGACFWKLGGKTGNEQQVYNTLGALLTSTLFLGILNSIFVQPVVSAERAVFYRERAAGMYSVGPWYLALATVEAMYQIAQAVLYVCVLYFMAGFDRTAAKFFWFLLFMFLTLLYFTYYGVACVAITPNLMVAAILSGAFYGLMNLFAGFVIPQPEFPGWWIWMYYLNPVSWTLFGLVASNVGDLDDVFITLSGQTEPTSVPDFLRTQFGYRHDWLGWVVLILIGWIITLWAIGAFAFKRFNFQKR